MLQILIQAGQDAVKKNRAICTHVVSQWTVGGIIACLLLLGCRLTAGGDVQGTAHGIQLASRSVPNFCHRPALHRQDKQQEDTQGIHNKLNKHSVRSVVKVAPTDRQACLIVLSPAASTSFTQQHGPRAPATCPALITHLAPLNELHPCRAHHICAGWYGRFVVHFQPCGKGGPGPQLPSFLQLIHQPASRLIDQRCNSQTKRESKRANQACGDQRVGVALAHSLQPHPGLGHRAGSTDPAGRQQSEQRYC